MRLQDRFWLWSNSKPPTRHAAYAITAFMWFGSGILFAVAVIAGAALSATSHWEWTIPFVLSILIALWTYFVDRRGGYVDAMHLQHVKKYEEKKAKIIDDQQGGLLVWFNGSSSHGRVPMEDFDVEYKKLFGKRPEWYSCGPFYRDHGFVGLREGQRNEAKSKL